MKFHITSTNDNLYAKDKITSKAEVIGHSLRGKPICGIELNSLEDLIELIKEIGNPIVIEEKCSPSDYSNYQIEIYDGYRE